ncbi:unnamed protein product [Strongylus vulgaris]|uniref:Uncharacterized protein n=1 Tax=Strongylus vulgaris TaxID=40348 RepID=A0A3P7JDL6_STRVU|nr:unnamed protein product [Strongylus vulgaris]
MVFIACGGFIYNDSIIGIVRLRSSPGPMRQTLEKSGGHLSPFILIADMLKWASAGPKLSAMTAKMTSATQIYSRRNRPRHEVSEEPYENEYQPENPAFYGAPFVTGIERASRASTVVLFT